MRQEVIISPYWDASTQVMRYAITSVLEGIPLAMGFSDFIEAQNFAHTHDWFILQMHQAMPQDGPRSTGG